MKKYFCDRCESEVNGHEIRLLNVKIEAICGQDVNFSDYEICSDCSVKLKIWVKENIDFVSGGKEE